MARQYGRGAVPERAQLDELADLQEKVLQGAAATHLADFAEQVLLGDQESKIRKTMFAAIDSDAPLDPMKAAQAWIELRAVYNLVSRLRKAALAGQSAHARLETVAPKAE